jgi:rubredoxin
MHVLQNEPKCPQCNSTKYVFMVDDGLTFLWRYFKNNNRLACRKCGTVWNEKEAAEKSRIKREDMWR